MKSFTDAQGRAWSIRLTLGSAKLVRDKLGVDLLQPESGDPPLLTRIGTDEVLLGEVLCALLEDQFEAHKVTDDDVRAGFDGRTMLAAQDAFYAELVDFFQSRGRNDRARAVAKQQAILAAASVAAETRIEKMDVEETVRHAMETSGGTSIESPGPSGETATGLHYGS